MDPQYGSCQWCRRMLAATARSDAKFCGQRCRQASWRFTVAPADRETSEGNTRQMHFAYADPPYPRKAFYYPENTEVDYPSLIDRLATGYSDGWALSVDSGSARQVWQHCPPDTRLCVWVKKPMRVKAYRVVSTWEALFVCGGRQRRQASVEVLDDALVYRGRHSAFPGAMIGMKPPEFSEWMFRLLGAVAGDRLDDLYPGSGAVSEAWRRFQLGATGQAPSMKTVVLAGEGDE